MRWRITEAERWAEEELLWPGWSGKSNLKQMTAELRLVDKKGLVKVGQARERGGSNPGERRVQKPWGMKECGVRIEGMEDRLTMGLCRQAGPVRVRLCRSWQ